MTTANVPVKSASSSSINWVQLAGPLASLLAAWKLNVTAEQLVSLVISFQLLQSVYTWVRNTWFSPRVLAPSV